MAVIAAAMMFPAASHAQFALGGGPSFPLGKLADEAKPGHHLQASVELAPRVLPFKLRTDLFYQRFNSVAREPSINVSLGGEWYRQLGFKLNGLYELPVASSVRPYGLIGGGWLREWHDDRTYSGTSHTALSFNAGVGVNVPIPGGVELFLEAPFLNVFGGTPLRTTPPAVYEEVEFKSLPTTIGIRF